MSLSGLEYAHGANAYAWQGMCTSCGDPHANLSDALVSVARCLSTTTVDSAVLMPALAFKLILLDKRPGFYPTEIGAH